ncbi:MAG: SpoIID/LytB domain-containing protein [Oscillospiraceae bacterium]|nr:SpoIID/LytB domain-containing protein [Oscillospiraceae bacterium]MBQ8868376.1 SpoIID/LytB domain-containing protein [Oscillospiraceae bacterium]
MKSSLKISTAAIGLVASVLLSAAASSAADKISAVDYIVEDTMTMAGQNEFFEQMDPENIEEIEIGNHFEILEVDDATLKPPVNPKKPEQSSSTTPSSSQSSSSNLSQSSQQSSSSSLNQSSQQSSAPSSSAQSSQQTTSTAPPTVNPDASDVPASSVDSNGGETLTFKANGKTYTLPVKEALKKVVSNELDGNFSYEAIKAQVVATHTYIKYYTDSGSIASIGMKSSYKVGGKIDKAVEEVYDTIMTYNGKAIYCPYFAVSCGKTQASKEVWGGAKAYLVSAESKYDYLADYYNLASHSYTSSKIKSNYLATKVISEETVRNKIQSKLGVTPSGDPSTWFKFLSEAEGGYTSGGYINKIVVAGKTTTGKNIRSIFGLRSACFEVSYSNGSFTFTTKGYGHGVGLSQWGAHFYADKEGWDYRQILSHYYKGIAFAKIA